MNKENANFAEKSTPQINIQKQLLAQERVQTDLTQDCLNYEKIKSIKYIGKQDVYNMEVETHHNFSVNGGLIVHNCLDAMRYACESFVVGDKFSFD